MPTGAASNSGKAWHNELLKWDPISSGEGDLLLDDLAKSFSLSSNASKTTKAIDFASAIDNIPSHGFQVRDFLSANNSDPTSLDHNDDSLHVAEKVTRSTAVLDNSAEQSTTLDVRPELDEELSDAPSVHHGNLTKYSRTNGSSVAFEVTEEIKAPASGIELELKCLDYMAENLTYLKQNIHDCPLDKRNSSMSLDGVIPEENEKLDTCAVKPEVANVNGK